MGGEKQSITIGVPPEAFFKVISDYESYPEFLSSVKHVEIEKKKGKHAEVHFEIHLFKTIQYVLEMTEEAPTRLSWKLLRGDLFKQNDGAWHLKPGKDGKSTEATYETEVDFAIFVPKMITSKLTSISLPSTLREFKERAEKLAAAPQKKASRKRS